MRVFTIICLCTIVVYYYGEKIYIMFKNKKEDNILEKFYDKNGTCIKIICKVPVGNLSRKDAEKNTIKIFKIKD